MKKTENLELNKPDYEDFADIAPINDNMDKIDSELKKLEIEAKNKDGGNADMVDGKHASDFTGYKVFNTFAALSESQYEGLFYIESKNITGISLKSGTETNSRPDGTATFSYYLRLYSNLERTVFVQTDTYWTMNYLPDFDGDLERWYHSSEEVSFKGHKHTGYDVEHDEVSVSGNNHSITKKAGTLRSFIEDIYTRLLKAESISVNNEGKSTADYAEYAWNANKLNGKAYENFVTNRVYHTKEDLSNPSFDKAFITFTTDASVIPNTSEGSSGYWHIMHFPFSNGCSTQFAMPFGTNKVYTRSSVNSKWSDWASLMSSDGGTMFSSEGDKSYSVSLSSKRLYISDNYCNNTSEDGDSYESIEDNYSTVITGKNITVSNSSHQKYFDDEISNEINITPTGISHTGDSTATITGFDVEGYEKAVDINIAYDWNTLNATGLYHIKTQAGTNRPVTNQGLLYVDSKAGMPFQIFIPDGSTKGIYKRSLSSNTWTNLLDLSEDFVKSGWAYSTDLNTVVEEGIYPCSGAINTPNGSTYGGLIVLNTMHHNSRAYNNGITQIFCEHRGLGMYVRWGYLKSVDNDTDVYSWSDWTSIGSDGGNADTVDGKHASDLQNYNNLTNKPTSLKNPYSLEIKLNDTSQMTYDGSASKTVNITPSAIGALPYTVISSGDFNEMKTPGIYTMKNCSNAPNSGSYYALIVLKSDTGESYFQQIAFKESTEEIWIRKNGSTTWKQICFNGHTHTKSQITDLTSLKNPYSLSLKLNGTTTTYDGSASKTVDIVTAPCIQSKCFTNSELVSDTQYSFAYHQVGSNANCEGHSEDVTLYITAKDDSYTYSQVIRFRATWFYGLTGNNTTKIILVENSARIISGISKSNCYPVKEIVCTNFNYDEIRFVLRYTYNEYKISATINGTLSSEGKPSMEISDTLSTNSTEQRYYTSLTIPESDI